MRNFRRIVLCLVVVLAALAGCGEGYGDRLEVTGTVKLKGEPVNDGVIVFHPLGEGSAAATQSGAPITKGTYKVPHDDGLAPGKYRVTITAGDGRTPAGDPDALPGPTGANIVSKDRIPPEFNTESKHEVEVKTGQSNVFNYDIP